MKQLFILLALSFFALATYSQCTGNLEEYEDYNTGPILITKDIVFDAPTISINKDIAVAVKDSSRLFIHFDVMASTWQVGTRVEFKFESGAVVNTYITKSESEKTGSYVVKRYDCQIESRKDLDVFYLQDLKKFTIHSIGRTYDLSAKKSKKFKEYFKCAANTVGIENVNYKKAKVSDADPYVDNTIVVSFGNQNNSNPQYDNVKCEYEKNVVDEFTGEKTTITKYATLGDKLTYQIHYVNGKTFLNFVYNGPLGCVNVESYVIIKFMDGSTEKFMNVAPEDCGDHPILKIDITDKVSILKVRDLDKIRVVLSDGNGDVVVTDRQLVKAMLNKCI